MGQTKFMAAAVITASASVLVAVLVFIFNQYAQIQQERRQIRLARVNSQLRDLYGPLNALVDVNERIWEALRQSSLPAQEERRPGEGTEGWRRWQDNALMPINRKMRDLIIEHADLLVDTEVPRPLGDFCAHVESVEIVMAAEKRGLDEHALVAHPGASYVAYVHRSFEHLKRAQQCLLKI
jgi:hypothetical protein